MCRILYHLVLALLVVVGTSRIASGAPFVNLNFEQATVPPGTQFFLDASLAFPGWTARINESVITTVYYDFYGAGEPAVVLYDLPNPGLGLSVYEGEFSAAVIGDTGQQFRGSLAQVGDIPADARSIRFRSSDNPGRLVVALNGQALPIVRLSPGLPSEPAIYGADITNFAGTTVELRVISPLPPNGVIAGADDITFSAQAIPEPTVAACGLLMLFLHFGRCAKGTWKEDDHAEPSNKSRVAATIRDIRAPRALDCCRADKS